MQGQASSCAMDALMQRLSGQSSSPLTNADNPNLGSSLVMERDRSSKGSNGSNPITPATDEFPSDAAAVVVDVVELQRLKSELQEARSEVARMNQELHTTNQIKSTFDHAIGHASEADDYYKDITEPDISQLQNRFNASTRPSYGRQESWPEDNLSDKSDTKPFGQAIWGNGARQQQQPNAWGVSMNNMNTQSFGGPIQVCSSTVLATSPWRLTLAGSPAPQSIWLSSQWLFERAHPLPVGPELPRRTKLQSS